MRSCHRAILEDLLYNLSRGGITINTNKWKVTIYQFGGTTGPARYPLFKNSSSKNGMAMLPRTLTKSRPGELGHTWMHHTPWLNKLSHEVAKFTKKFYMNRHDDEALLVQNKIVQSTNNVHSSLIICNTFFTALVLVKSG